MDRDAISHGVLVGVGLSVVAAYIFEPNVVVVTLAIGGFAAGLRSETAGEQWLDGMATGAIGLLAYVGFLLVAWFLGTYVANVFVPGDPGMIGGVLAFTSLVVLAPIVILASSLAAQAGGWVATRRRARLDGSSA